MFGKSPHRKLAFLDYKTSILKSRKIDIFPKGLVHGFGQNYEFFYLLFLGKIRNKKVFGNVLDRKLAFLDYKNMDEKKNVAKLAIFQWG